MNDFKKRLPRIIRTLAIVALAVCGGWQLSGDGDSSLASVQYLPYTDQHGELTVCLNHHGPDIQQRPYSQGECIMLLKADLKPVYDALNTRLNRPLTEEQKNALAVFMFSAGSGAVPAHPGSQTMGDDALLVPGLIPGMPSGL
ncbi:glycoside hydrolase family protein [Escherichia coli]|nr:endolysin [Escherichia coli]